MFQIPAPWCRSALNCETRRMGVLLDFAPQCQGFPARYRGGGICSQHAARGTHEYAKMIRPSELAAFSCREAGLNMVGCKGMEYNPITQRYALTT